ncbi:acyl-CoA thioesterase [Halomonas alkalisoli]|uniref:acyl-CoA thioesterase n=1 Tax=Halomonas alkalisoli TaxID=2907158 RepID=UPI001F17B268|nr:thioesterase family protein [Halomonas alkalisoli]MCE9683813.1 thioesterase family protein [Halomonas alkalisoli]
MERIKLEFPEHAWRHVHTLSVRVGDMNYAQHLGHDTLISLLQEARAVALATLGASERNVGGFPGVVGELAVQYQAEAYWPDVLEVTTAIPIPEGKGIKVFHRMVRRSDRRQVATAMLTMLLVDPSRGGKVVSLPESFLSQLGSGEFA